VQGEQVLAARRALQVEVFAYAVDALLDGAACRVSGLDGIPGLFFEGGAGLDQVANSLGGSTPAFSSRPWASSTARP
jgi:hypothetical protein